MARDGSSDDTEDANGMPKRGTKRLSQTDGWGHSSSLTRLSENFFEEINLDLVGKHRRLFVKGGYIDAKHPVKLFWNVFTGLLAVFTAIIVPFQVSFKRGDFPMLETCFTFIHAVLVLDILLNTRTTSTDESKLLDDDDLAAVKADDTAVKTEPEDVVTDVNERPYSSVMWLIIDILSVIPVQWLVAVEGKMPSILLAFSIFRVRYVTETWQYLCSDNYALYELTLIRSGRIRVITCSFIAFFLWHWSACTYWFIFQFEKDIFTNTEMLAVFGVPPYYYENPEDVKFQYIHSLFWALQTTLCIGYGEIPQTELQTILISFAVVIGSFLVAGIIGVVSSSLAALEKRNETQRQKLLTLQTYMQYREVPAKVRMVICRYYQYMFTQCHLDSLEEMSILETLPQSMRSHLNIVLNKQLIQKSPLFNRCSSKCIKALIEVIDVIVYLPGQWVYQKGEEPANLYIVRRGEIHETMYQSKRPQVANKRASILKPKLVRKIHKNHACFGSEELLSSTPYTSETICHKFTELCVLEKSDFLMVAQEFPQLAVAINLSENDFLKNNDLSVSKMMNMLQISEHDLEIDNINEDDELQSTSRSPSPNHDKDGASPDCITGSLLLKLGNEMDEVDDVSEEDLDQVAINQHIADYMDNDAPTDDSESDEAEEFEPCPQPI